MTVFKHLKWNQSLGCPKGQVRVVHKGPEGTSVHATLTPAPAVTGWHVSSQNPGITWDWFLCLTLSISSWVLQTFWRLSSTSPLPYFRTLSSPDQAIEKISTLPSFDLVLSPQPGCHFGNANLLLQRPCLNPSMPLYHVQGKIQTLHVQSPSPTDPNPVHSLISPFFVSHPLHPLTSAF